jgi:hypothetical protein
MKITRRTSMRRFLFAALLLLSPLAADAQTVGPTIGPTCALSWNASTTNADGTPLSSPIGSYRVYVTTTATPIPLPGTTVPTAILSAGASPPPTTWNCAGVGDGQHYAWVTASNVNGESAVQAVPLAFVFSATPPPPPPPAPKPGAPSGLRIGP